jgi:chemotaxis signal transduction protein
MCINDNGTLMILINQNLHLFDSEVNKVQELLSHIYQFNTTKQGFIVKRVDDADDIETVQIFEHQHINGIESAIYIPQFAKFNNKIFENWPYCEDFVVDNTLRYILKIEN